MNAEDGWARPWHRVGGGLRFATHHPAPLLGAQVCRLPAGGAPAMVAVGDAVEVLRERAWADGPQT